MSFTRNNYFSLDDSLVRLVMSTLSEQEELETDENQQMETKPEKTSVEFKKGVQPEDEITDPVEINPVISSETQTPDSQANSYVNSAQL